MQPNSVVLFLGTGESSEHLIAEGLARRYAGADVEVVSAARRVQPPDRAAVSAMQELGIDIGTFRARPPGEAEVYSVALVVMTVQPLSDVERAHVGALVSFRDNSELHALRQRVRQYQSLRGLVGKDPKMLALFDQIREVAAVNAPVLIQGESGTGKELVASAIHEESARAGGPFVPINCGAQTTVTIAPDRTQVPAAVR